ncbi:hypothetical protein DAI22_09g064300 [Oryza sativa Japonica Group]|nr:uncharacterized protein LOC107276061 [Oryza sativa Japonica Group]KAF2915764.1 hypothetical protein DAI22_09g064300 [Oryza sativa Japonica Group]
MQPAAAISCYISCLEAAAAAVSFSSPSMRRRQRRLTTPAALLPFSTAPDKYGLPRHRFAPISAAINFSPDALVHPARESERQKEKAGRNMGGQEMIVEAGDSVTLQFPVTEIVGGDESKVNNAIEVAIDHGDVLTISLRDREQQKKQQPSLLDVRLLMTPGYDEKKVEWRSKKVDDKVWLEVTIKKKAPTEDGTRIVDISAIEEN